MRDDNSKKSKLSWPRSLVKKLFSIGSKTRDCHADDFVYEGGDEEWKYDYSEMEAYAAKKTKTERSDRRHGDEFRRVTDVNNYRISVATWNVAGKSPTSSLNLEDWLHTSPPADIYVLGFQEIVPLNAGNVLGAEDNGPARKWLALIQRTLNSLPGTGGASHTPSPIPDPIAELDSDFEGSARQNPSSSFLHRPSFQCLSRSMRMGEDDRPIPQPQLDRRFSVGDRGASDLWGSSDDEDEDDDGDDDWCGDMHHSPAPCSGSSSMERHSRYCLVASKQMVGIFLSVWIRGELMGDVRNMKVSCVGRGLMGYLGNKGSISISMFLHQTSFCFVCSHLTSGQKEGDELRRNSDVMEILRKTRFPMGDDGSPQTILEHDRVIWLGDLNYRIALSYRSARALIEMRNWRALLRSDQLRIERRQGRVFEGWSEGKIYFPPTYKYSNNSDRYSGEVTRPREKRRTPAWCDRILWHGRGLYQLSYIRGESRFSDHRPVYSMFLAEVESLNHGQIRKSMACSSSWIEIEELVPQLHREADLWQF